MRSEVGKKKTKNECSVINAENFLDLFEREDRNFCLVVFIFLVQEETKLQLRIRRRGMW